LGTTFAAGSRTMISDSCASGMTGTKYVVVLGQGSSGKVIANQLSELASEMYVPGASAVFIRGSVSRVDRSAGQFEISGTRVLSVSGKVPALGSAVDVVGTQPLPGGAVLADLVTETPASQGGAAPNGSNAIIGSGAMIDAIIGSGKSTSAIIGSGAEANAIIGSGKAKGAIIGSGATTTAIIGSGSTTNAIIGSGAMSRAIIGSGAAKY
ncbi:MAG TPA: hypothetical protein VFP37_18760, partial [Steroidobacteraceae bacterium]|nr:hypothetical protein [Steroidobacteraceae bacterium]